jgi:hypothetical protein
MGNITPQYDLTKIRDPEEFVRFAGDVVSQILTAINGNLEFNNLKTQIVSATFSTANVNTPISHGLNKTGVNYIVASLSAAASIYRGTGDTTKTIVLKASAPCSAVLILF